MARNLKLITKQNRQRRRKHALRRFLTVSVLVVFIATLGYFTYAQRLNRLVEANAQLEQYEEEYSQLVAKEEYYRNEISKLENEDYIAKLAREKYFKSEEGEIIFKLPDDSKELSQN